MPFSIPWPAAASSCSSASAHHHDSINGHFRHLKDYLNDNPDCHLELGYREELAHLVYAGADLLVVPSMFEPCGLAPLTAMRYGTVPVVRATGGMIDTVFDRDHSGRPLAERNGKLSRLSVRATSELPEFPR